MNMKRFWLIMLLLYVFSNTYGQVLFDSIFKNVNELNFPYVPKCDNIDYDFKYEVDTVTLKQVFKFSSDEVCFWDYDYDSDLEIRSNSHKSPVYSYVLGKFIFKELKCLLVHSFINNDPINEQKRYICVFSKNGSFIDKLEVEHVVPSLSINNRVALIDANEFILCDYTPSEEKVEERESSSKEKFKFSIHAILKKYIITDAGEFVLKKSNTILLKQDSYYKCDNSDDPLLEYK